MLRFRLLLCLFALASCKLGLSKTFDFHDPKGFNSIEFSLAGAYGKSIVLGKISEVSGTLNYDPSAPSRTTGTIEALSRSAQSSNPEADNFLRGPSLFDAERFPRITFALEKVTKSRRLGKAAQFGIVGNLTIKGRSRKVIVSTEMKHLPGKLKARIGEEGDLLVIRGNFSIRRSDFDLGAGKFLNKAADKVDVELALVGGAAKKSAP